MEHAIIVLAEGVIGLTGAGFIAYAVWRLLGMSPEERRSFANPNVPYGWDHLDLERKRTGAGLAERNRAYGVVTPRSISE